jgi:phosphatidylinositol 3-kinase
MTPQQLCEFLKNVEWDVEESRETAAAILKKYESVPVTLMDTLTLWKAEHALSPLIQEFNISMLKKSAPEELRMFLPQLILAVKGNIDRDLCQFLIKRCSMYDCLAIPFFWTLMVEIEREKDVSNRFYPRILFRFMEFLAKVDGGSVRRNLITRQGQLVEKLVKISGTIRQSRAPVTDKRSLLDKMLKSRENDLLLFDPLVLPIRTDVEVVGIIPEKCSVFRSNVSPLLLTFLRKDGKALKCIFKSGDDLRQDTVVTQLIRIMNRLLEKNGLMMPIKSYDVLSTGVQHGFVEYVESMSLEDVLQRPGGLKRLLKNQDGTLEQEKMKIFVSSTAAYTIITYILCVGDRHLDNILITDEGCLFHIDYAFLGREPKPFAPLMKLCPEMIDVMGGKHSGYYNTFLQYCFECFDVFRNESQVLLDALELMCDGGISDVNDVTVDKIKKRLMIGETEGKVIQALTVHIEKGFEDILPKLLDGWHRAWGNFRSSVG